MRKYLKPMEKMNSEKLSSKLLEKARKKENTGEIRQELAEISREQLSEDLKNDDVRKAFWLNIYNAFTQILLRERPERYRFRSIFFMRRYVKVAGKKMSLNKVENGMLRSSKLLFGFGYIVNPLALGFERKFRVREEDPRIHFALNCGAETCPPIKFYSSEEIDSQLEKATETYLNQEIEIREEEILVPRVFHWYRGDFGGKEGIKNFLSEYGYQLNGKELKFKEWSWEMQLDAFKGEING
jgi:hypothetical protein